MKQSSTSYSNLPDLPTLESVELKNWHGLIILSFHIGMALLFGAFAIWSYFQYREFLETRGVVLVIIIAVLTGWSLLRLLTADLYFRTDPRGICIGGILHRRFVQWVVIRSACSIRGRLDELAYVLNTSNGKYRMPTRMEGMRHAGHEFGASVWQHLRQCGKADHIELSCEALSFWDEIPDEVPQRMEWTGKSRAGELAAAIVMLLLFGGGIAYLAVPSPTSPFWVVLVSGVALIAWLLYRDICLPAVQFSLREDGFEARRLAGIVRARWSEVTAARWERQYLVLELGRLHVLVPHDISSDDSGKLILALIRKLREIENPQALVIPDSLRVSANTGEAGAFSGDQRVELRLAVWEKYVSVFPALFLSLPILIPFDGKPVGMALAGVVVAAICIFAVYAAGTYVMAADSDGVSKRFLWWSKSASWQDVASIKTVAGGKSTQVKRLLVDAAGKALLDISTGVGNKQDRERFRLFVDARLAQLSQVKTKSWLARPYGA